MMWNYLVSGLLVGSTVVLFDGDPGYPDLSTLWRLASETRTTWFGTSAPFLMACRKAGLDPARDLDLQSLAPSDRRAHRCRRKGLAGCTKRSEAGYPI